MTNQKYKIEFHNDHIFTTVDDRVCLVDTGAPGSVGNGPPLQMFGEIFPLIGNYFGVTTKGLSEFVGKDFDVLMGCDVLGKFPWRLDWQGREITFFNQGQNWNGNFVQTTSLMGVPRVPITVNGREVNALLDTGCCGICYGPQTFDGEVVEKNHRDFFPGLGWFNTTLKRATIEMGTIKTEAKIGHLPHGLGDFWIIGTPVLDKKPLGFDLKGRKIHIL